MVSGRKIIIISRIAIQAMVARAIWSNVILVNSIGLLRFPSCSHFPVQRRRHSGKAKYPRKPKAHCGNNAIFGNEGRSKPYKINILRGFSRCLIYAAQIGQLGKNNTVSPKSRQDCGELSGWSRDGSTGKRVHRVGNAVQIQPLRRAYRPTGRPVLGAQCFLNIYRRPCIAADAFQ